MASSQAEGPCLLPDGIDIIFVTSFRMRGGRRWKFITTNMNVIIIKCTTTTATTSAKEARSRRQTVDESRAAGKTVHSVYHIQFFNLLIHTLLKKNNN